jgi:hypothetical protein
MATIRLLGWTVTCAALTLFGFSCSPSSEQRDWISEAECANSTCPALSEADLRERVIKSFLHMRLAMNLERRDGGGGDLLVLLPAKVTAARLESAIERATLLDLLGAEALVLRTHVQIEALTVAVLDAHHVIASYSMNHREADIVSLDGFRSVSPDELSAYLSANGKQYPKFDVSELQRGYGRQFFWIQEFNRLGLQCCDGRGSLGGLSIRWHKQNSTLNIRGSRPKMLSITARGGILSRGDEGDFSYIHF